MSETWFIFTAYNSQAHFGYGTPEEADRYCDVLNRGREINYYHAREMTPEEYARLESGDDTDGFRLDDALATQAEQDE